MRDAPGTEVIAVVDRRREKLARHEQNKRTIVELTAWITAVAAALVVGLQAGIAASATAPDVPRVTPLEYQYR
jgi:hypothetical protein